MVQNSFVPGTDFCPRYHIMVKYQLRTEFHPPHLLFNFLFVLWQKCCIFVIVVVVASSLSSSRRRRRRRRCRRRHRRHYYCSRSSSSSSSTTIFRGRRRPSKPPRRRATMAISTEQTRAGMFFVLSTRFQFNNHAIHQNKKMKNPILFT